MFQFQTWLDANRGALGTAYNTGVNGIASTRTNLQWSARRVVEMERYFEVGYVEDEIEDIDDNEEEQEEETDKETEEEEGDGDSSANIAALSIVTLFVTLGVNLMG